MLNKYNNMPGRTNLHGVRPQAETLFYADRSIDAIKSIWTRLADMHQTKIVTICDDNIPECFPIDALKVQYCLNNLVGNAVKNTNNGIIRIVVTQLQSFDQTTYLALSVQDTGAGISPKNLQDLFKRMTSGHTNEEPEYGVIDTSLPMTQDLVDELGGKLLVKSELGGGSTFSLVFPITTNGQTEPLPSIKTNAPNHSEFLDLNILVVDDYNLNQLTIKSLLHNQVGKVFTAGHGYEALEILHSCAVDIIFMDIHMPILDGIETTLKIRESDQDWAGIHIVAMTADPQYQQMRLCRKIGMDDTLAKPFHKADVVRVLQNYAMPYKRSLAE